MPGQTYPTNETPYPSGTYPTCVTLPPYTPFVGGTYPPSYTPPPYYRPSTFRPGGTYPTNQTPYPYGTYPVGTVPMGTPFVGGTYPPGFTFKPQPTTQSPFIPEQTYPTNVTPYPLAKLSHLWHHILVDQIKHLIQVEPIHQALYPHQYHIQVVPIHQDTRIIIQTSLIWFQEEPIHHSWHHSPQEHTHQVWRCHTPPTHRELTHQALLFHHSSPHLNQPHHHNQSMSISNFSLHFCLELIMVAYSCNKGSFYAVCMFYTRILIIICPLRNIFKQHIFMAIF